MAPVTIHLRSETKNLERRSALSPDAVRILQENGFKIHVERSSLRCFSDDEFTQVGATLVPEHSWPDAPADHIIMGLKELEDRDPFPLKHTHIQFAHCYKGQGGWQEVLARFPRGGGTLYDLEFLADERGRRVAAFGYHAGYAGSGLSLLNWAWQLVHGKDSPLPAQSHYQSQQDLDKHVKDEVLKAVSINGGKLPRVLVIGALGRCGTGALDMCRAIGIPEENLLKWDLPETSRGGPFQEMREDADILVNCIYLDQEIPKFITKDFLKEGKRILSVVCDVSCDTTNPNNPLPICDTPTTFDSPTLTLPDFLEPPLSVIVIDHLPTLLPREASDAFSNALLPSLLHLPERDTAPVWVGARKLFDEKVAQLPQPMRQKESTLNGKA